MQRLHQFEQGQYQDLITDLQAQTHLTVIERRLLGVSALRLGQFQLAEPHLLRAHLGGDPEATVEYGNLLRVTGRWPDAQAHFADHAAQMQGELRCRLDRWWGVTAFQAGDTETGLRRVEQAMHGYLALGDEIGAARVTVSLARMLVTTGQVTRATRLYRDALRQLPAAPNPLPRLTALQGWLDLLVAAGEGPDIEEALQEAQALLPTTSSQRAQAHLLTSMAMLHARRGQWRQYGARLMAIQELTEALEDVEVARWLAPRLAEYHARQGRYAQGHAALYLWATPPGTPLPPAVLQARGVLAWREGQLAQADRHLRDAAIRLTEEGQYVWAARAKLHHAHTLYLMGAATFPARLREAAEDFARLQLLPAFTADLEDVAESLHAGALDPALRSVLAGLLTGQPSLRGIPLRGLDGNLTRLDVLTLGGEQVTLEGEVVPLSAGAVAVLGSLVLQPGQTRQHLQAALYPDKFPNAAASAIKSHLAELRRHIPGEVVLTDGPYHARTYHLSGGFGVRLDLLEYRSALAQQNLARALSLYRGSAFPGMTQSDWAEGLQLEARTGLSLLAQQRARAALHAGEPQQALAICDQVLTVEPELVELHELRLQAARQLGDVRLIAQYAAQWDALI
ncbi:BTAD domain-containing putative transcriptional regulator [Deinococcus soli (ex Cha et al. 2016)]|uniref:BTAD domain-containing putative transcriptional regulator n=1 Tax=Deinococcus soli (ex Cha et al. 2016) TaxID=1309411 RepID=UPI00166B4940|nr:BTAD domain-containing putative transcriptional regulator [Deinococcus soli (ex Cha et al. 2016)]GGB71123.1 hypothetical protein GCM10008019_29160 [Deinococcus soli (ex Cha et al. 2016)]